MLRVWWSPLKEVLLLVYIGQVFHTTPVVRTGANSAPAQQGGLKERWLYDGGIYYRYCFICVICHDRTLMEYLSAHMQKEIFHTAPEGYPAFLF